MFIIAELKITPQFFSVKNNKEIKNSNKIRSNILLNYLTHSLILKVNHQNLENSLFLITNSNYYLPHYMYVLNLFTSKLNVLCIKYECISLRI